MFKETLKAHQRKCDNNKIQTKKYCAYFGTSAMENISIFAFLYKILTLLWLMFPFYTPEKTPENTFRFLVLSGVIKNGNTGQNGLNTDIHLEGNLLRVFKQFFERLVNFFRI